MRRLVYVVALVAACGGGGATPDSGTDGPPTDAAEFAPTITSFQASPSSVTAPGTPTMITWTWTYGVEPTFPDPACSIDNGVGAVTRGQMTSVTLSAVTTFTLTCTNSAGMAQRQVVVGVPPTAPLIATFTANPTTLVVGAATNVQFTLTLSNTPSPAATCTIEHGVGNITPGATGLMSSITQTGTRMYRVRCSNGVGVAATAQVTLGVNECAAGTFTCGANSTCSDSLESYNCTCNNNFTLPATSTSCSALVTCTVGVQGAPCGTNATCTNTGAGTACVCNPGFFGDGTSCARQRVTFVSSATGNGNLSTTGGWTDAGAATGLAAADAVCQARANAVGLTIANGFGPFKAWMSDGATDAYCRMHNQTGTKATMCGGTVPNPAAGPWVNSTTKTPFAPRIDSLLAPTRQIFNHVLTSETGAAIPVTDTIFTGTDENGVAVINSHCTNWTSNSAGVTGARGEVAGSSGGSWTKSLATDPSCFNTGHLRCMEVVDATTQGPLLNPRPTTGRRIFVTSVSGNGQMSTWPDAVGTNGITGADEVCRARARFAGYTNANLFEAMLSTGTTASSRIANSATWFRPDGTAVALSKTDLIDSTLGAAVLQMETGAYLPGGADTGGIWTGTFFSGTTMFATGSSCTSWTTTAGSGTVGRHDLIDGRWAQATLPANTQLCTTTQRLMCYED